MKFIIKFIFSIGITFLMLGLTTLLIGFYLQNYILLLSFILILIGSYLCYKGTENKNYRFSKNIPIFRGGILFNKDALIAVIIFILILIIINTLFTF